MSNKKLVFSLSQKEFDLLKRITAEDALLSEILNNINYSITFSLNETIAKKIKDILEDTNKDVGIEANDYVSKTGEIVEDYKTTEVGEVILDLLPKFYN